MALMHIRISGDDAAARAIENLLGSLEQVDRVEPIADLMPHMDDEDSSSAGLSDNLAGARMFELAVHFDDPAAAGVVRDAVEQLASELSVLVEYEHDEG